MINTLLIITNKDKLLMVNQYNFFFDEGDKVLQVKYQNYRSENV